MAQNRSVIDNYYHILRLNYGWVVISSQFFRHIHTNYSFLPATANFSGNFRSLKAGSLDLKWCCLSITFGLSKVSLLIHNIYSQRFVYSLFFAIIFFILQLICNLIAVVYDPPDLSSREIWVHSLYIWFYIRTSGSKNRLKWFRYKYFYMRIGQFGDGCDNYITFSYAWISWPLKHRSPFFYVCNLNKLALPYILILFPTIRVEVVISWDIKLLVNGE